MTRKGEIAINYNVISMVRVEVFNIHKFQGFRKSITESLNAYLDEFQSKNPSYEVISVNVTSNYITVTYKDTSQNCQVDGESREALSKNKEMEQLRQQLADLQLRALQEQVELQFRL